MGYARVSSIPQDTRLQRDALAGLDCVRVFEDKISSRAKDRPGLLAALDYLRAGDTLYVWKLDRLARSVIEARLGDGGSPAPLEHGGPGRRSRRFLGNGPTRSVERP